MRQRTSLTLGIITAGALLMPLAPPAADGSVIVYSNDFTNDALADFQSSGTRAELGYDATGGLNGTGAIYAIRTDNTLRAGILANDVAGTRTNINTYSFNDMPTFTTTAVMYYIGQAQQAFATGISTDGVDWTGTVDDSSFNLVSRDNKLFRLRVYEDSDDHTSAKQVLGDAGSVATDQWYEFTSTWTWLGGNDFQVTGSLQELGVDGDTPGDIVVSLDTTTSNIHMDGDTVPWFGIGAFGDFGRGVRYIDSLTVTAVPEPTSLALLGAAGLAMMMRRRRS